jgi:hypothetical protein
MSARESGLRILPAAPLSRGKHPMVRISAHHGINPCEALPE